MSDIEKNTYLFINIHKEQIEIIAEGLKTFSINEETLIGNALQKELDKLPEEQWIKDRNMCTTNYILRFFEDIAEVIECDKTFIEHLEIILDIFFRFEDWD